MNAAFLNLFLDCVTIFAPKILMSQAVRELSSESEHSCTVVFCFQERGGSSKLIKYKRSF